MSHLLQVCGLALEYGDGDVTLAQAALLHDVIEDTPAEEEQLRTDFGDDVADIVMSCTDLLEGDTPEAKGPWRERKERYIDHLRDAPRRTRIVSAWDKLHNLTNIVADVRARGIVALSGFNAQPDEMLWYYESIRRVLGEDLPPELLRSFEVLVEELAAQVRA